MGNRDLLKAAIMKLGQLFSPAAAPVAPSAQVVKEGSEFHPPVLNQDHILHGMHNLQDLKTFIKGLIPVGADKGEQIFRLEGSDHNSLFQDIVIVAPDTAKFVLRLNVFPKINEDKTETDLVIGVEVRCGRDEKFMFDPVSNAEAEQEIIHRLMVWMMDKCPHEHINEFDRRIVDHIHLIGGVEMDKWLVRHVPNTFNEVVRPTKEPVPS